MEREKIYLEDKVLNCKDCGKDFIFSTGEQEFFAEKGFAHAPSRCPECRAARKGRRPEGGYGGDRQFGRAPRQERRMFEATCAWCGTATQVPFQPREDRPVYCQDCFREKKRSLY